MIRKSINDCCVSSLILSRVEVGNTYEICVLLEKPPTRSVSDLGGKKEQVDYNLLGYISCAGMFVEHLFANNVKLWELVREIYGINNELSYIINVIRRNCQSRNSIILAKRAIELYGQVFASKYEEMTNIEALVRELTEEMNGIAHIVFDSFNRRSLSNLVTEDQINAFHEKIYHNRQGYNEECKRFLRKNLINGLNSKQYNRNGNRFDYFHSIIWIDPKHVTNEVKYFGNKEYGYPEPGEKKLWSRDRKIFWMPLRDLLANAYKYKYSEMVEKYIKEGLISSDHDPRFENMLKNNYNIISGRISYFMDKLVSMLKDNGIISDNIRYEDIYFQEVNSKKQAVISSRIRFNEPNYNVYRGERMGTIYVNPIALAPTYRILVNGMKNSMNKKQVNARALNQQKCVVYSRQKLCKSYI